MSHNNENGALDNDSIVQYTAPYQFKQPQDILPLDDTPFLMIVCTNKSRLDATLSALLDYSHYANVPETYEHNVDIINALANIFFVNGLECGNMDLCNLIEQCLTAAAAGDNQSLADVIKQIIQNSSSSSIDVDSTNQYDIRYENGSTPISDVSLDDGQGGCDLDVLWGVCFEVATRIAKMGLDILETYTASADKVQKIANISSAIPFVGDIANSLLSAAADIAQDIENAYVAYETSSIIEDVACDLFCMVQNECRFPTFDELLDYYATGGNSSLIEVLSLSYAQLYGQIFNTIVGNPIVWYGVQTFALATLYLDGAVLGNEGTKVIEQWALIGSGNPSNAHLTLCNCPPETPLFSEWDFAVNDGTWDPYSGHAVYSGGAWRTGANGSAGRLYISIPLDPTTIVKQVGVQYTRPGTQVNWSYAALLRDNRLSSSGQIAIFSSSGTNDSAGCFTGSIAGSNRAFLIVAIDTQTLYDLAVHKITIEYEGAQPPGITGTVAEICPP